MIQKKRKILFFTDCFIYGGCEIVLANLSNSPQLNDKFNIKYSFRSFKQYRDGLYPKIQNKNILKPLFLFSNTTIFYRLGLNKNYWNLLFIKLPLYIIAKLRIYNIYNYIALLTYFKKENPQILFINNGGYPGSEICRLAVIAGKSAGIKNIVFNVNNMAYPQNGIIDRLFDKLIVKRISYFITASNAARLRLNETRSFDLSKIVTFPNTIEEYKNNNKNTLRKEYNISAETIIIGSAGLLTKRKGYDVLITSIKKINLQNPSLNIKVVIIGEGEERIVLTNLIKELNLEQIVILPGHKLNILDYLSDFDIFVLPSVSNEDMPYVILEAMMMKKPVIGTSIAGIPEEITEGETGFVVEPGNYVELANKLMLLIENKEIRLKYGEAGYNKYIKLFSYEKVTLNYLNFFISICN